MNLFTLVIERNRRWFDTPRPRGRVKNSTEEERRREWAYLELRKADAVAAMMIMMMTIIMMIVTAGKRKYREDLSAGTYAFIASIVGVEERTRSAAFFHLETPGGRGFFRPHFFSPPPVPFPPTIITTTITPVVPTLKFFGKTNRPGRVTASGWLTRSVTYGRSAP